MATRFGIAEAFLARRPAGVAGLPPGEARREGVEVRLDVGEAAGP